MINDEVILVSITPNAEETMAYCARVSNESNQKNPNISRLLSYCIKHGHWSVFEQANMIIEINTSRAISPQIIRHRSFTFQEFSQRYSTATKFIPHHPRRQDKANKQNSIDDLDHQTQEWFKKSQNEVWNFTYAKYNEALEKEIAKESARVLLPLNTSTKLYMNGTIRSWIHYIQLRTKSETQLEHRIIAEKCKKIFIQNLPQVAKSLEWKN